MRTNNDELLTLITGLIGGAALLVMTWHFGVSGLIPPEHRYDPGEIAWAVWSASDGNSDDLKQLIAFNYPWAFLADVAPSVLLFSVLIAAWARTLKCLLHALAGFLAGAIVGFVALQLPFVPDTVAVLAMPGLALLLGGLVPLFLVPVRPAREITVVRGTRIVSHVSDSVKAITKAKLEGATALAGVVLDRKTEVRHFTGTGVTGSGKSTAFQGLMATALHRGDRHVVADPDGGYMALFWKSGDMILNPFDARSAKWDILAEIEKESDYKHVAASVLPFTGNTKNDEWITHAQLVFAACLRTWHKAKLGTSDEFIAAMGMADTDKLARLCEGSAVHRYFQPGAEKMLAGMLGTLTPALEHLEKLALVQGEPFSVKRWMREGKGSLWMPYRADQIADLSGLVSCWMRLSIFELLSWPDSKTRRVWFHVDELDALGRIQGLKDAQVRSRKKGGVVVLGLQSISQVRAVYGEADAHAIVENCDNRLILRCGMSEGGGTAKFASDLVGEREVEWEETTHSRSSGPNATQTTSTHKRRQTEKAILPAEVMQLADRTGLLKLAGRAEWQQVGFDYVQYPTVTAAYLHPGEELPDAAE